MAYDARRLVQIALHVGDALSDRDMENLLAAIHRLAAAVDATPGAVGTSIVIVETENAPTATQRRRIGEAARTVARSRDVMITSSPLVRGIMTAIRWLTRSDARRIEATFATYAEARPWLVAQTGYPGGVFDVLHDEVRAQVGKGARTVA